MFQFTCSTDSVCGLNKGLYTEGASDNTNAFPAVKTSWTYRLFSPFSSPDLFSNNTAKALKKSFYRIRMSAGDHCHLAARISGTHKIKNRQTHEGKQFIAVYSRGFTIWSQHKSDDFYRFRHVQFSSDISLQWKNVQLPNGRLHLQRTNRRGNGHSLVV